MPIPYIKHDRDIADNVLFRIRAPAGSGDPAAGLVSFQFPPKILSDNRRGTWNETEFRGTEPVALFATSGPREFSLKWNYIVESASAFIRFPNSVQPLVPSIVIPGVTINEGVWSIQKIRENVNRLRGYFSNFRINRSRNNLIVDFKFPAITGSTPWTCRIKSIDVKHSENLIGSPDFCYPLRTDITVDLRLWTKTSYADAEKDIDTSVGVLSPDTPLQDVVGIDLSPSPRFTDYWY